MAEIVFSYNQNSTMIQCKKDEKMIYIFNKYASKIHIELSSVYFLYGGNRIDSLLTFNDLANEEDKKNNKMNILVYSYQNNPNENTNFEKSKDIICPICGECCLIKMDNYKITLYECKNSHILNDISLYYFLKTQKIDLSRIKCDKCNKNKNTVFQNEFYKCLSCKKNLCPLCKENHCKEHDIIEYNKKDYICNFHNENFYSYCNKCKVNLCMFCESEHKDKENIINFKDILTNKNMIKSQVNELRAKIDTFKELILELKNFLDNIIENLEIYYDINKNIIYNFEKRNRSFQLLKNIGEIIKNNCNILEDLNIVKDQNNINLFNNCIKIFNKMNIQSNNINNNTGKNNITLLNKEQNNIDDEVNKISKTPSKEKSIDKSVIIYNKKNINNNKNNTGKKDDTIQLKKNINDKNKKFIPSKNIFNAELAEKINRYKEMMQLLEDEFRNRKKDFNSEERKILSISCKNFISGERNAINIIMDCESEERKINSKYLPYVLEYKEKITNELTQKCQRIIKFIEEIIIRAEDDEAIAFYKKLIGDYYRYMAEYTEGDIKIQVSDKALKAYEEAEEKGKLLPPFNQISLGLYLNLSVFYNKILNNHQKAIEIAKKTISEVDKELPNINKKDVKNIESISIYNIIKENLDMWINEEYK